MPYIKKSVLIVLGHEGVYIVKTPLCHNSIYIDDNFQIGYPRANVKGASLIIVCCLSDQAKVCLIHFCMRCVSIPVCEISIFRYYDTGL